MPPWWAVPRCFTRSAMRRLRAGRQPDVGEAGKMGKQLHDQTAQNAPPPTGRPRLGAMHQQPASLAAVPGVSPCRQGHKRVDAQRQPALIGGGHIDVLQVLPGSLLALLESQPAAQQGTTTATCRGVNGGLPKCGSCTRISVTCWPRCRVAFLTRDHAPYPLAAPPAHVMNHRYALAQRMPCCSLKGPPPLVNRQGRDVVCRQGEAGGRLAARQAEVVQHTVAAADAKVSASPCPHLRPAAWHYL